MAQSILVAYDGSEPGDRAVETAATAFEDPALTLINVVNLGEVVGYASMEGTVLTDIEHFERLRRERSTELLEEAAAQAASLGVDVDTVQGTGDVAKTIVTYADEHDVDHIVVGSHGRRGVNRLLLGSVAEKIVRRAPVPVTVVR